MHSLQACLHLPPSALPGSDDHLACVFELRPGPGVGSLGSSSPNVENWRLKSALRGHGNNVVDVAWSPDDALLATASLDGTAAVWAVASGLRTARLEAHTNFIKGVAWDPVGSYLATQVRAEPREPKGRRGGRRVCRRTAMLNSWPGSTSDHLWRHARAGLSVFRCPGCL